MATFMLIFSACTGSADEVDAPGTSTALVRTSGALADGFDLEPGSGVIGAVFPVALPYGGRWQAIMRVDGDLQRVFEGYVGQAEDLGFSFDSELNAPEGQRCGGPADGNTGYSPAEQFRVRCIAYGSGPDDVELYIGGVVETNGEGRMYLSLLDYSNASRPAPLPSGGPVAAATDSELAPGWTPNGDERSVHIVEGTEVVFGPDVEPSRSYMVMLRVSGELMPVMRGYEEQFINASFDSSGIVGDEDEPILETSTAGGGTLTAVGVAGNPSYVLIERIND